LKIMQYCGKDKIFETAFFRKSISGLVIRKIDFSYRAINKLVFIYVLCSCTKLVPIHKV